jgi:glycosyltransferase involved in cell wall biosynthesis
MLHFRTPEKFGRFKSAVLRRVIRRALRRAGHVIAVSEFTAADVRRFAGVPGARLTVVSEGGPRPQSRAGDTAARHFLFVGKIERTKGVTDLIEAFAGSPLLTAAGWRLILSGPDGNASPEVAARIAALDPETRSRIEKLGFVDEGRLRELYLTTRGFVFPSVSEGFGLVLLEAMAHGAPVIAARATSLPEVVADAGLLVAPGDTGALRRAMERLATDDALCCDLRKRGYRRLSEFSWQRAGEETMRILRETAR